MERDIEKVTDRAYFAKTLRRMADAVEAGESFRIQVAGHRFTVPASAEISIEHEAEEGDQELEMQFTWSEEDEDD